MTSNGQHKSKQRAYWARISDRERKRAARATSERKRHTKARTVDADTMRWRALQDRKGTVAATLNIGPTPIKIIHSTLRTDSYEVLGPRGYVRGGRGKIGLYLGSLLP